LANPEPVSEEAFHVNVGVLSAVEPLLAGLVRAKEAGAAVSIVVLLQSQSYLLWIINII